MTISDTQIRQTVNTVWLFLNRIAGSFDKSQQHATLRELVGRLGGKLVEIHSPGELRQLLDDPTQERPDFIIAAGGDGTAAAIATLTKGEIPIAIYPAGTENVLAKYLAIPTDFSQFQQMLRARRVRRIDAGLCGERVFLLMLSAGFEAQVVHQVHRRRRGHLTKLHYMLPTFRTLRSYLYPKLAFDLELEDGTHTQCEGYWIFVSNVPRYALGYEISPLASPEDGLFDVCILSEKGCWATTTYITALLAGTLPQRRDLKTFRARSIHIRCPGGPVPLQTDGDPAGFSDTLVRVLPSYIPLIVPEGGA